MGEMKSRSWRESGKLLSKADAVTGSLKEHHLVCRVPRNWERLSHEDFVSLSSQARHKLENKMRRCLRMPKWTVEAQVKGEPLTPDELKAREAQEFLDDITKHIMRAQTMEMEAKVIIFKRASLDSTRAKYTEMLENDLDRHRKVLFRLIGMMKKVVTETPEPDPSPLWLTASRK